MLGGAVSFFDKLVAESKLCLEGMVPFFYKLEAESKLCLEGRFHFFTSLKPKVNYAWRDVPTQHDTQRLVDCPHIKH